MTLIVSWAGMRGVVTLAAVFLLPADTPQRALLALAAFTVVAGTLLIQGLTLPALVRWLRLPGPDAAEDALQAAALVTAAAQRRAGRARRGRAPRRPRRGHRPAARTRDAAQQPDLGTARAPAERAGAAGGDLPTAAVADARRRAQSILEARDRGVYDDEVLRVALAAVDIEESLLDRIARRRRAASTTSWSPRPGRPATASTCARRRGSSRPARPEGCEECLRDGTRWVHLRLCLSCGHVGCCDSSLSKHADAGTSTRRSIR